MKEVEYAYIAALVDTIGTIKIRPPKQGEVSCLYVWITNKEPNLMFLLQRHGAYVFQLDDGQFRAKWKDHKAYRLIKSIIKFSQIKKEQLQLGLEFMEAKTSDTKDVDFDINYRLRLKLMKKSED